MMFSLLLHVLMHLFIFFFTALQMVSVLVSQGFDGAFQMDGQLLQLLLVCLDSCDPVLREADIDAQVSHHLRQSLVQVLEMTLRLLAGQHLREEALLRVEMDEL